MFITFEGGEGSGKTTQIALLATYFEKQGRAVVTTREPGGTAAAEAIREFLMDNKHSGISPLAETLMFLAARAEHVEKLIKPALAEGKTVLCDRFSDSTFVYQGIARKLGVVFLKQLQRHAIGDFTPDVTFLLDIDPAEGLKRAADRRGAQTRFDTLGLEFHTQVRNGFLQLATAEPERFRVIDASATPPAVHQKVVANL
jgi:dTMP kinase